MKTTRTRRKQRLEGKSKWGISISTELQTTMLLEKSKKDLKEAETNPSRTNFKWWTRDEMWPVTWQYIEKIHAQHRQKRFWTEDQPNSNKAYTEKSQVTTCTRGINLVKVMIAARLMSTEASTLNKRISAGSSRCICSSNVPIFFSEETNIILFKTERGRKEWQSTGLHEK